MGVIFAENWDAAPVGASPPPGFSNFSGNATVTDFSFAPGGHSVRCNGGFSLSSADGFASYFQMTFFALYYGNDGSLPSRLLALSNQDLLNPVHVRELLMMRWEGDNSISVYDGDENLLGNSFGLPVVPFDRWFQVQLDVLFGIATIDMVDYLNIAIARLYINGAEAFNASRVTGIPIMGLFAMAPVWNFMSFEGPSGGYVDNMSMMSNIGDGDPFLGYPKARVSQLAIEPIMLPDNPNARSSQLVMEYCKIPTRNSRTSQLVVEVISTGGIAPPGSGSIYET